MCVRLASSIVRARPKSVSTARSTDSSSRMFDGFTSRCTRPWAWAAARPDAACMPIRRISSTRQRPVVVDARLQRPARHVLHHQERHLAVRLDVVNRHDVLVDDRRRRPAFAGESLAGRADVGQVRGEHLDRDRPIQLAVVRLEHDAHAAAPITRSMSYRPSRPSISGWLGGAEQSCAPRSRAHCDRRADRAATRADQEASGVQANSAPPLSDSRASFHQVASPASSASRDWHVSHCADVIGHLAHRVAVFVVGKQQLERQLFAWVGLDGHRSRSGIAAVRHKSDRSSNPFTSSRSFAITRLRAT